MIKVSHQSLPSIEEAAHLHKSHLHSAGLPSHGWSPAGPLAPCCPISPQAQLRIRASHSPRVCQTSRFYSWSPKVSLSSLAISQHTVPSIALAFNKLLIRDAGEAHVGNIPVHEFLWQALVSAVIQQWLSHQLPCPCPWGCWILTEL